MRTGADTLVDSLLAGGIDVCFTNPGTSEMHFVKALDRTPEMKCILGLFEGVVTGAADGYYRVADRPAATLLHLAPGLGNGLANLHNARKARSGIVNIVGEHATYFRRLETPLGADIEGVARPFSGWVRTTLGPEHLAQDAAEAIQNARRSPGLISTLILPADVSWSAGTAIAPVVAPVARRLPDDARVAAAADVLLRAGPQATLLLGNVGVRGSALEAAGRIAAQTGCRLLGEIHNARMERGAGRVPLARIPYTQPLENALRLFEETQAVVLAGAAAPLSYFAYPDKPYRLTPPACQLVTLAEPDDDIAQMLELLAERVGAGPQTRAVVAQRGEFALPTGPITPEGLGAVLGALLPENAIVVDEAVTAGRTFFGQLATAAPHDWLSSVGASIGFALPSAIGAAVAAPARKVVALSGDGSAMYTLQSLWTMARENLDVTVVVFANRRYQILRGEFGNLGLGEPGQRADGLLSLADPVLDWCALAGGQGVENGRATDLTEFAEQLRRGLASGGPYLVEVVM